MTWDLDAYNAGVIAAREAYNTDVITPSLCKIDGCNLPRHGRGRCLLHFRLNGCERQRASSQRRKAA